MSVLILMSLWANPAAYAQDEGVSIASIEDGDAESDGPGLTYTCRRLIGVTGGAFDPGQSWFFEGNVGLAFSPTLGLTCDLGTRRTLMFGVQTAPLYVTREIGTSSGRAQWLNLSVGGVLWNGGRVQVGPIATVGWRRFGGGARVLHLPYGDDDKPRGMEYRLEALYNGTLEIQASVAFTLSTHKVSP